MPNLFIIYYVTLFTIDRVFFKKRVKKKEILKILLITY